MTSRIGLVVIALSASLSWHYIDKAAAVRSAKQELADKVTIEVLTAQRDEANRRAKIAEFALNELNVEIQLAKAAADKAEKELEEYEKTTTVNDQCVVDQPILDRLRNR